ncbi:MAG: AraC family transcriptional regulator [Saprospiraceae bacterium]|jgi:AraC-like DNA-binding protein|nr:AraC family transcriptional regulator [Saprospiraceae bacterium]
MKPIPFKVPKSRQYSLRIQVDDGPHFYDQLHYHPEYQITAIQQGKGILYAGNGMVHFQEGDIFMIGANVPHLLKNAPVYFSETSPEVYAISLFFDEYSFGQGFFEIHELQKIKQLLADSKRVIKVTHATILDNLLQIQKRVAEAIIIQFLQILSDLSETSKKFINSDYYQLSIHESVGQRLNDIIRYSFEHLQETIRIEEVAEVAHLSRSQFSRYFKLHTGKTFIQFLNELRVESACNLLLHEHYTIEQICYEVGFQNLSNFNRQFRKSKGLTPSAYRKSYKA